MGKEKKALRERLGEKLREKYLELALAGKKFVTGYNSEGLDPLPFFARRLGYALYNNNLDEINSFRSLMAEYLAKCKQASPANEVMKNWLEALLEISHAYSISLEEIRKDQLAVKTIRDSGFGVTVMLALDVVGKTLADLEKELAPANISLAQINGALYGFCKAGMVSVFGKDQQAFALSLYGEKILQILKEEDK